MLYGLKNITNNFIRVSKKFDCAPGQVSFFTKKDPFNPENELSGYICRAGNFHIYINYPYYFSFICVIN
jgi:hypothetical protein